jgi:hypothetical protein
MYNQADLIRCVTKKTSGKKWCRRRRHGTTIRTTTMTIQVRQVVATRRTRCLRCRLPNSRRLTIMTIMNHQCNRKQPRRQHQGHCDCTTESPGTSQRFDRAILKESKTVPVPISHNHASSCDDDDDDSLQLLRNDHLPTVGYENHF